MLGLILGLCCGVVQFIFLRRFVRSVSSGGKPAVGLGILQLLLPAALLLGCAFFMPEDLVWAALGIVCPLILGSVVQFIRSGRNKAGSDHPES